jgi:DNA (cytosine-5)-methyltransferase 1
LDGFAGPGGATRGYQRAGWHVTAVDIVPQPSSPADEFVVGDAIQYVGEHWDQYDAVHLSPTCQTRSRATAWRGRREDHPDTLGPALAMLRRVVGVPWVVENVEEACWDGTMTPHFLLCGTMFGLGLRRHRVFEVGNWLPLQFAGSCAHRRGDLAFEHKRERAYADAMGCDWVPAQAARQCIPPAYSEYIGGLLLAEVLERAA